MSSTRDTEESQTVIVSVTLAVHVAGAWGDDCALGQLRKQAVQSAIEDVNRMATGKSSEADLKRIAMRSVEVTAVTWRTGR